MTKQSVFRQALAKGGFYSFVFFLFFMMSSLPIFLLFVFSFARFNLPGLALSLIFAGILAKDVKQKNLYRLTRDMAVLNLTLWFLLGFFSIIIGFVRSLSGAAGYIFIIPYALISGYFVYYLLKGASKKPFEVLSGSVVVSTMIAIVSAINNAVIGALTRLPSLLEEQGIDLALSFNIGSFNQHLAFAGILIFFNIPFVRHYWLKRKKMRAYLLYLVPILTYIVLAAAWTLFQEALLGGVV